MAGIYLHIPYCKVKCHYCDFHFSTQRDSLPTMIGALKQELLQRSEYLKDETVNTIYFGGGTPSLLQESELSELIEQMHESFTVSSDAEITVECNPDDLDPKKIAKLKGIGVNRLSIGIQSFDDNVLKFMNRAHTTEQTMNCLEAAKKEFENITVDLIYGIPNTDLDYWKKQLDLFAKFDLPHLSSYCLTIEPKTVFGKQAKSGQLKPVNDEASLDQFQYLIDFMNEKNYEHYEISNFAKEGFISKHNSAYWRGHSYLGIGPSAHSYDGKTRGWNVANNAQYIKKVNEHLDYHEVENLSVEDRCNDYLLTRLRTKWGVDLKELSFVPDAKKAEIASKLNEYSKQGLVKFNGEIYLLSDTGKYRADGIAADLFI